MKGSNQEDVVVAVNKGNVLFFVDNYSLKLPHSCPLLIIKCVPTSACVLEIKGRQHPNKVQVSQNIGHAWQLLIMEVKKRKRAILIDKGG